ncbi:MAG: hypothetical protein CMJ78_27705, partial [Planctomycetaceae bacterium]|nr:hypothetical protein [Planctomycetaceae bacterium]
FSLILGICFGSATLYTAFTLHFVKTDDGFLIVPKRNAGLHDTYVDVREWTVVEWSAHPDLVYTLVDKGFEKYVRKPVARDILRRLFPKLYDSVMKDESRRF